jgi:hypothetical protein
VLARVSNLPDLQTESNGGRGRFAKETVVISLKVSPVLYSRVGSEESHENAYNGCCILSELQNNREYYFQGRRIRWTKWKRHVPPKRRLTFNVSTRRCVQEERTLHNHWCENLKAYFLLLIN